MAGIKDMSSILTKIILAFAIIYVGLMFLFQNWFSRAYDISPEQVFTQNIKAPIPESVKVISGNTFGWQGYDMKLVFQADKEIFPELIDGFESISCAITENGQYYNVLKDRNASISSKDLEEINHPQCFYKKRKKNSSAHFFIFWDEENGMAYYYGARDSLDKPYMNAWPEEGIKKDP